MKFVCPTVTATNAAEYRHQIEAIEDFVSRVHIDCMDGDFAPSKSPPLIQAWWPLGVICDMHVMYRRPLEHIETLISLQPHLVIIHAEAEGAAEFVQEMHGFGIGVGMAVLRDTPVSVLKPFLDSIDHVLIFSGDLGHFGGTVDLQLLDKVAEVKRLQPRLEVGWDGGIHADNAAALLEGGVDVLNVGGFIQRSSDPQDAYDTLMAIVEKHKNNA